MSLHLLPFPQLHGLSGFLFCYSTHKKKRRYKKNKSDRVQTSDSRRSKQASEKERKKERKKERSMKIRRKRKKSPKLGNQTRFILRDERTDEPRTHKRKKKDHRRYLTCKMWRDEFMSAVKCWRLCQKHEGFFFLASQEHESLWFSIGTVGPVPLPFADTAHSFAGSALARSAALIRLFAHSVTHSRAREKVNDSMSQNQAVLNHSEKAFCLLFLGIHGRCGSGIRRRP